jgi:hypothetical protein
MPSSLPQGGIHDISAIHSFIWPGLPYSSVGYLHVLAQQTERV